MQIAKHIKEHAVLGVSGAGANAEYVNTAAELTRRVAAVGSRVTLRDTLSENIAISASTTVVGTGTTWYDTPIFRVNDLVLFGTDTQYYKIKEVTDNTHFELYEAYTGTPASTTMTYKTHYMDWYTFILMPGTYVLDGLSVFPGQSFTAIDKNNVRISEQDASPSTPFVNWSENRMYNLSLTPSESFGTVDGFIQGSTDGWAGMESRIDNCLINHGSAAGEHGGGQLRLPLVAKGKSYITNCFIRTRGNAYFAECNSDATSSIADTEVNISHCNFEYAADFITPVGADQTPGCIANNIVSTLNIEHCSLGSTEDYGVEVTGATAAYAIIKLAGVASALNISHTKIRGNNTNTSSLNTYGLDIRNASAVNIYDTDIEIAGTQANGIKSINAGAVVNVRHSRIKSSSVCIDQVAGAVNYDAHTSIITGSNNGTSADT